MTFSFPDSVNISKSHLNHDIALQLALKRLVEDLTQQMASMTTTANHKVDSAWKSAAHPVQVAVKKVRDDALKKIQLARATAAGDR